MDRPPKILRRESYQSPKWIGVRKDNFSTARGPVSKKLSISDAVDEVCSHLSILLEAGRFVDAAKLLADWIAERQNPPRDRLPVEHLLRHGLSVREFEHLSTLGKFRYVSDVQAWLDDITSPGRQLKPSQVQLIATCFAALESWGREAAE